MAHHRPVLGKKTCSSTKGTEPGEERYSEAINPYTTNTVAGTEYDNKCR